MNFFIPTHDFYRRFLSSSSSFLLFTSFLLLWPPVDVSASQFDSSRSTTATHRNGANPAQLLQESNGAIQHLRSSTFDVDQSVICKDGVCENCSHTDKEDREDVALPSSASPTSFKVDPTERDRVLKELESHLLKMFGMGSRPRPSKPVSIPPFIIEMYLQQQRKNQQDSELIVYEHVAKNAESVGLNTKTAKQAKNTYPDRFNQQGRIPFIGWANTIRSHALVQSSPSDLSVRLDFNVSLPSNERLIAAELRIFCNVTSKAMEKKNKEWRTITVDELFSLDGSNQVGKTLLDQLGRRPIDVQTVQLKPEVWLQFDVLQAVRRLLQGSALQSTTSVSFLVKSQPIVSTQQKTLSEVVLNENLENSIVWEMYKPVLLTYR